MNENRGIWRGKRADNGEWYIGSLITYHNGIAILPKNFNPYVVNCQLQERVDPSTLGECTGLTDKNGELIFEGDIIDLSDAFDCEVNGFFKVVWDDAYACFYFESISETPYVGDVEYDAAHGEVIGNIHDNPELIQKGAAE